MVLDSGTRDLLSMFGTTWVCETNFSTVLFMKSKYSSITFNENLVSKLRHAVGVKYRVDLKEYLPKKKKKISLISLY